MSLLCCFVCLIDPKDKQIKFVNNIESGVSGGITELEDAITTTMGVEGLARYKKICCFKSEYS
ncbi:MAG: hypothetical protein CM15mV80_440 [uncultured marine virus]|nr:MAG: hypothetical protein CM15mV80_440 [uncultured marine virus]